MTETVPHWPPRQHPRLDKALAVQSRHSLQLGVTRNISAGGLFVRMREAVQAGDRIALEIALPGVEVPLSLTGEVVRREPEGFAVRFLFSTDAQRELVAAQVQRLLAS
jgi:type IV pilus assembly protein PilZ